MPSNVASLIRKYKFSNTLRGVANGIHVVGNSLYLLIVLYRAIQSLRTMLFFGICVVSGDRQAGRFEL